MSEVLNFLSTIGVALIGYWTVRYQTKAKERSESIQAQLDKIIADSNAADAKIKSKLDYVLLMSLKTWLISEMTKIKDKHYTPNDELKSLIHEAKKVYNSKGGDSYVDTMFDRLVKDGLL